MESTVEQLTSIEARIASAQQKNTQQLQKVLLTDLYSLRQTFLDQLKNLSVNPQKTTTTQALDEEDPKDKQIKELKAENARLQYRITHLVRNLKQKL